MIFHRQEQKCTPKIGTRLQTVCLPICCRARADKSNMRTFSVLTSFFAAPYILVPLPGHHHPGYPDVWVTGRCYGEELIPMVGIDRSSQMQPLLSFVYGTPSR